MLQNPSTFSLCTWLVHYASQRANLSAVKSDIACIYKIFHQSNHIQTAEPKAIELIVSWAVRTYGMQVNQIINKYGLKKIK